MTARSFALQHEISTSAANSQFHSLERLGIDALVYKSGAASYGSRNVGR
jgi:hypothetical protein